MANGELKTITIDGTSMDNTTYDIGNYLKLDDNTLTMQFVDISEQYTVTVPTGSMKSQDMYTFTQPGLAIISYGVEFPASATGARYSQLLENGNPCAAACQRGAPAPTSTTIHSGCERIWATTNKTVGIRLYQTSGSSMNVTVNIHGILLLRTP